MKLRIPAIIVPLLLSMACTAESPAPQAGPPPSVAPAAAAEATLPVQSAVFGRAPASNGQPAIIVLAAAAAREPAPQEQRPVMDQVSLTFIPAVLVVRTGQPTEFRNSDDVLHNVRVNEDATRAGTFNVAIPTGEEYLHTFEREGFYNVGCDIHPGMAATIYASPSPYATISDQNGYYEIQNVAPGAYKALVYSGPERIERPVEVLAGHTEINFTP